MIEIEAPKVEVATQGPFEHGWCLQRCNRPWEAGVALASLHSPCVDPLTRARVARPLVVLSERSNLGRRQACGRIVWPTGTLQRGGIPMAVAGVGQEIVRAQSAILASALPDDRGSYRSRLGQCDGSRASECQGTPEIVRGPVSYVIKGAPAMMPS